MNIERKDIDTLNAELHIHIAPSDYAERVDNAIKKQRKTMQMPGFRPGNVPMSLVKQRFGKSILAEEINKVIQENLYKFLSENKIEVLGSPIPAADNAEVGNWDNPADFNFTYQLGLAPAIEVDLNASHTFDYYKVAVSEELINRQVKDLARRYGKMSDPETSDTEDMLMVELNELGEDGMLKDGGISNKTTVSIEFVKDAATKASLIGLTVGSTVEIDPHHLTDNHEDLAKMLGVTHHAVHHLASKFQAKVTEVKRIEPHAVDQELFDKLYGPGEVNAEEVMRDKVKADLEQMFSRDSDFLFKREFAKKIMESVDTKLPDAFLKRYIQLTNEKPVTVEMVEHDYPFYAAQLRWELIEGKIIRKYELRVSSDDALTHVKQVLASRYAQYGLPMEDEMLTEFAKQTLAKKEEAKNVYDFLYEEKMIALVKEKCTLTEIAIGYEDFIHKVQQG
jgi:trigger factor